MNSIAEIALLDLLLDSANLVFNKFRPTIAVVGAGASGLGAAKLLSKAGFNPLVLEGRNRLGGRVNTVEFS